jgi:ubiquinone/menaquinone biosynthesis C-methylase UbiE
MRALASFTGTAAPVLLSATTTVGATEAVLYSFCSRQTCQDEAIPSVPLIRIGATLYGTTSAGGSSGGVLSSRSTRNPERKPCSIPSAMAAMARNPLPPCLAGKDCYTALPWREAAIATNFGTAQDAGSAGLQGRRLIRYLRHGVRNRAVTSRLEKLPEEGMPEGSPKLNAAATYNAAADHFDDEPLGFWERIGRRTVERLELSPGAAVLDVGCGTGASALPAAEMVGPHGRIIGVDLAERLLEAARKKATRRGLTNIAFATGDMEQLAYPDNHFDAVVSVFSIFFVSDMVRQICELWRMVRPGGVLAITTWGPRFLEPGTSAWWNAVKTVRPDLVATTSPWDRIVEPPVLRDLLRDAGISNVEIVPEEGWQTLRAADDWWTIVLGCGFRWTVEQLKPDEVQQVRAANLAEIRRNEVPAVETNAIFATARKPALR